MNNAEKFQEVFGYYATEMWAKSEKEFLDWTNAEYNTTIKTNERTEEWILDDGTPICSACHKEPCWSSEGYDFTDFCPNCGAKMKG